MHQIAGTSGAGIYTSANFGYNWTKSEAASTGLYWSWICSDSTGRFASAVVSDGGIYYSSDYGESWTKSDAVKANWAAIAADQSGQLEVAVDYGGGIHLSINSGRNWTITSAPRSGYWVGVASDVTGKYLAAANSHIGIYTSTNNGTDWHQSNATLLDYNDVCSDGTGRYLSAVVLLGGIYNSQNYGNTWEKSDAPNLQWTAVVSDKTGRYLTAVSIYGGVWSSVNYGRNWTIDSGAPVDAVYWQAVTSDSTGQYRSAAIYLGKIYTNDYQGLTYMPSSQPTAQPSIPTSQPSARPSTQLTAVPSGQPTSRPTAHPSHGPSYQPYAQPTSMPSSRPSVQPSSKPSVQPSLQPTCQPRGFPTVSVATYGSVETVISTTTAQTISVTNLGHGGHYYVTVHLLRSYLSAASNGYITFTAGSGSSSITLNSACAPAAACTGDTYCAVNIDVTEAIDGALGGSLLLSAAADVSSVTGVSPETCYVSGLAGVYFQVNYTLTGYRQPTAQPTSIPTMDSGTSVVINNNINGLVTSGGAPVYVIGFVVVAFAALGVLLVRIHDEHQHVQRLSLLNACLDLALMGNSIITEIFYIVILFQAHTREFAALSVVMILARLFNAVCGGYLLFGLHAGGSAHVVLIDSELLLAQSKLYSAVQLLVLLDVSMFRYLPWRGDGGSGKSSGIGTLGRESRHRSTNGGGGTGGDAQRDENTSMDRFASTSSAATSATRGASANNAMGFPDSASFKLCMSTKLLQMTVILIVQSIVLAKLNASEINNGYTLGLFILNLAASVAVLVSACVSVVLHWRAQQGATGSANIPAENVRSSSTSNPLSRVQLTQMSVAAGESALSTGGNNKITHTDGENKNIRSNNPEGALGQWEERVSLLEDLVKTQAQTLDAFTRKLSYLEEVAGAKSPV